MTKSALRKIFREKRNALSPAEIDKMNDLILLQFQKVSLPYVDVVHSYIASETLKEPDTSLILRYLEFRNPQLKIVAPKIDVTTLRMTHYHITSYDQLERNIYGIEEPASGLLIEPKDIDLVLIPMLGFNRNGHRVGYGKGYYDRFLADCRSDTLKAGISFFEPVESIDDTNAHDVTLDFCVTPMTIYEWPNKK